MRRRSWRTVSKYFDTSGSKTSISCPDELVHLVAPVVGGLVEVSHAIDTNLDERKRTSNHQHSILYLSETANYGEFSLLGMSATEHSLKEGISKHRPWRARRATTDLRKNLREIGSNPAS